MRLNNGLWSWRGPEIGPAEGAEGEDHVEIADEIGHGIGGILTMELLPGRDFRCPSKIHRPFRGNILNPNNVIASH